MKRWLIRIILILMAAVLLLAPAVGATSERIVRFQSDVTVSRQNVATISETITYDFGATSRHGIFRVVPVEYRPSSSTTYYLKLTLKSVTDPSGKTIPSKVESSGSTAVLRIGDPDKTVTGAQTYRINYELSPLIDQKDGRDHLALNLFGDRWEVPIEEAVATIRFEAEPTSSRCYLGAFGSTDSLRCAIANSGSLISLQSRGALSPGEDMTIEAYLPDGYTDHYLQPNTPVPRSLGEIIAIVAVSALAVVVTGAVILIVAGRQLRERRRKSAQTIVAQYEPPQDLTPAQVGLLHDDKSSLVEITATLIDLAVRGYIRIEQTSAKTWLSRAKYRLTSLKPFDGKLESYEAELLKTLFGTKAAVDLDSVDKAEMAEAIRGIHAKLKESLKVKGFYGRLGSEPGIVEKALDAGNISDVGAKKWAEVKGFELYLTVAEKDRLKFTDAPERTPKLFNAFLPYAVALGVEKDWAKQFEGIDVSRETDWYVGPSGAHFGALALSSDLSTSFSSTIGSSFTAPSSGGGGGFSGGGFGGGGGGSW